MTKLTLKKLKPASLAAVLATVTVTTGCATTGELEHSAGEPEYSASELANKNFIDKLSGKALVSELKKGGYVIYFRHGQTERDYADQVTAEMGNCATQRVLSHAGWVQASQIRQGFYKYNIPFDQVISSQYCRAWQTAQLAFGKFKKTSVLNFPKSADYTDAQVAQMKAQLDPLLSAVPAAGTNTIIVGHDDLFDAATGIYPDPQGIAYVVKPQGNGKYTIIANVLAEEWPNLGR